MKIIVESPVAGRDVKKGVIAVNPNNPEYGSIMLSQTDFGFGDGGFLNTEKRVSFISGEVGKLEGFVDALGLTPGCDYSVKTGKAHKLVIKEQTTPFFEGQAPKINPRTQEQLATKDGEPIYRRVSLVTEDSAEANDIMVAHVSTAVAVATPATAVNINSNVQ